MKWLAAIGLVLAVGCGKKEPAEATSSTGSASAAATSFVPTPAPSGEWNAGQIDWQPYDAALKVAQRDRKPVLLVVSAPWCPHCKNYSHVFEDPRVVERSRDFVMVHLDSDAEPAIAAKYALDGTYIPRTYFLDADGKIASGIHPSRPRYQYFYDERDPASTLDGMAAALRTLRGS